MKNSNYVKQLTCLSLLASTTFCSYASSECQLSISQDATNASFSDSCIEYLAKKAASQLNYTDIIESNNTLMRKSIHNKINLEIEKIILSEPEKKAIKAKIHRETAQATHSSFNKFKIVLDDSSVCKKLYGIEVIPFYNFNINPLQGGKVLLKPGQSMISSFVSKSIASNNKQFQIVFPSLSFELGYLKNMLPNNNVSGTVTNQPYTYSEHIPYGYQSGMAEVRVPCPYG